MKLTLKVMRKVLVQATNSVVTFGQDDGDVFAIDNFRF